MDLDSLLQSRQRFGVRLGLERMAWLLTKLGDLQTRVPIIHVAGTNGKGSVCAYLASVLTAAGYRTGRLTSPHLIHWQERICIDQNPIPEADLLNLTRRVISVIPTQMEDPPTVFEIITAVAWLYFVENQVDIAVIEVGLGGRLDATNICDRPLVTIITSISYDHTNILGNTLEKIATEKAGICKAGRPLVIGKLPAEAAAAIRLKAKAFGCAVTEVVPAIAESGGRATARGINYPLPLLGNFQLMNSAIAIAAIQELQNQGWQISRKAIEQGMASTTWPGRMQWLTYKGQKLLIDGAHNPEAAIVLRQYLDGLTPPGVAWIIGIMGRKDQTRILEALLRPGDAAYLVDVPEAGAAPADKLAHLAQQIEPELSHCQAYPDLEVAITTALASQKLPVLCGSLYLVGAVLNRFGPRQANLDATLDFLTELPANHR